MARTFHIDTNPYEYNEHIYLKDSVEFQCGINVLVGCNGAGKTTLMRLITEQLNKEGTPVYQHYDKRCQSIVRSPGPGIDMFSVMAQSFSSEGEGIYQRLGMFAGELGTWVRSLDPETTDEAWFFIDSLDSGMSIDVIEEYVDTLRTLIIPDMADGIDFYIVIAANDYAFTKGNHCIDVINLESKQFSSYEEYREFVLESKKQKEARYSEEDDMSLPIKSKGVIIVAGSRHLRISEKEIFDYLDAFIQDHTSDLCDEFMIVSGGARGIDQLAYDYAKSRDLEFREFKAHWESDQKSAGYKRNRKMHEFAAQLPNRWCVCFWDGESTGTPHNFELAQEFKTPLSIYHYNLWPSRRKQAKETEEAIKSTNEVLEGYTMIEW